MSTAGVALERIAAAIESLAVDPEIKIPFSGPECPSCGARDPLVNLAFQEGGTGKMSEIVVDCQCTKCRERVFIVIESYSVHKSAEMAINEIQERERAGVFDEIR